MTVIRDYVLSRWTTPIPLCAVILDENGADRLHRGSRGKPAGGHVWHAQGNAANRLVNDARDRTWLSLWERLDDVTLFTHVVGRTVGSYTTADSHLSIVQ